MVTIGWAAYGIGLIGSIIIIFFTMGLGSLGYGFCNYFDQMISNQTSFNQLGGSNSQNPFVKLKSCFYGDGNVLDSFSLGEEIGTVTEMFAEINTFYDYNNALSNNYIDTNIATAKINGWMSAILSYKKGVFTDYNQSVTTDDNPNYAVNSLNLYTYKGGAYPTCSFDKWVFDAANCTFLN
jgi:hypothetical protein